MPFLIHSYYSLLSSWLYVYHTFIITFCFKLNSKVFVQRFSMNFCNSACRSNYRYSLENRLQVKLKIIYSGINHYRLWSFQSLWSYHFTVHSHRCTKIERQERISVFILKVVIWCIFSIKLQITIIKAKWLWPNRDKCIDLQFCNRLLLVLTRAICIICRF